MTDQELKKEIFKKNFNFDDKGLEDFIQLGTIATELIDNVEKCMEDWGEVMVNKLHETNKEDKEAEKEEILSKANSPLKALRYNHNKPKYSLLDLKSMEPGVRVLEFGANKYSRDNWKKGMPISEILDSMLRHVAAIQSGEWLDPESGLPHIGHIQCNALFLGGPNVEIDIIKQCSGNWDEQGNCKCNEK